MRASFPFTTAAIRRLGVVALVCVPILGVDSASAQTSPARTLDLSFEADGTVTLHAQNVSARDVLAEWARKCGCYVVNADKLTGSASTVPVLFEHASQASVLASLLRQAAGYVLTPRRAGVATASNYEVIYVLPTSVASPNPVNAYAAPLAPTVVPLATVGAPDDEIPPVQPPPRSASAPSTPAPTSAPVAARPNIPGVFLPSTSVPLGTQTPAPAPTMQPGTTRPAN